MAKKKLKIDLVDISVGIFLYFVNSVVSFILAMLFYIIGNNMKLFSFTIQSDNFIFSGILKQCIIKFFSQILMECE